jgi:hypothetical protein
MPIKKIKEINLIPQNEFDETSLGRILKWALSTFRVMVIITELIVMSAFLSRFWLDAKNSDLNEEIGINKSQVLAYSDIETEIRLNQKRIGIAKSLYSQRKIDIVITEVSKLIPPDVSFNSISITGNRLEIKAIAFSERSIAQFLVNLDNYEGLKDVNLSQIASSAENESLTMFTVTGLLK